MWHEQPNWEKTGGAGGFCKCEHDLKPFFSARYGLDAIPLGVNKPGGYSGACWNTLQHQGHGLCFAPNRTGKGATTIIPALLTYGGSTFVIDPKGENAWATAQHRREMGQRVVILDPWNEVNRRQAQGKQAERVTKFNPLLFTSRLQRSFTDDVASLAEALIVTSPGEQNPHFPNSAREFVGGVIALVKEAFGQRATMNDVRRLITGNPDVLALLAQQVHAKLPDSLGVRKLGRFLTEGNDEIAGVRATAITQTGFLDSPDLLEAMESDSTPFSMDEFTAKPTTIYVVLPGDKLITYARWLRVILSLALQSVARAATPPKVPALMLIDEMGTIGPLRSLEAAYGLLAGYGVRFFGFYQNLPQLRGDYPKTWETFISNCSIVQLLGARDMDTAEYFSKLLGTTTVSERSADYWHRIMNPSDASPDFTRRPSGSRPVMYPQEIISLLGKYSPPNLPNNTQLLMYMQGGHNCLMLQNPYFYHPGWRGQYRTPPQYAKA